METKDQKEQGDQELIDCLNNILDLQIDIIHGLLEIGPLVRTYHFQKYIQQRKNQVDQLKSLLLANGGRIDKRVSVVGTPHEVVGSAIKADLDLIGTNDQLIKLYRFAIEQDYPEKINNMLKTHLKAVVSLSQRLERS